MGWGGGGGGGKIVKREIMEEIGIVEGWNTTKEDEDTPKPECISEQEPGGFSEKS